VKNAALFVLSLAALLWVALTQTLWTGPVTPKTALASVAPVDAPPAMRVRVEHEMVTVPLAPVGTRHAAPARPRPEIRTLRPERYGMLARTKRAFFGDGRHRPEPFPKPR
jgi:hypothetical protein